MVRMVRRRYLLFQIYPESNRFRGGETYRAIQNSILALFGAHGLSLANPSLRVYEEGRCAGILRCSHKYVDTVKAAFIYITEIDGKPASFRVIRTSGTIKSLMAEVKCQSRRVAG